MIEVQIHDEAIANLIQHCILQVSLYDQESLVLCMHTLMHASLKESTVHSCSLVIPNVTSNFISEL